MSGYTRLQRRRLADVIVDEGLVTRENIDEALAIQSRTGETITSILVDMGCVADSDIAKVICHHYQLPFIRLSQYEVDTKLAERFPPEFLHLHKIFPFDSIGGMILCAVSEIPDEEVLREIPRMTRCKVALYVALLSEVEEFLKEHRPLPEGVKIGGPRPAAGGAAKGKSSAVGRIFDGESSEDLLEALDSTWESIFEAVEKDESESEDED